VSYYGLTFEIGVDRQQKPITIISVNPEDGAAPRMAVQALRAGRLIVFPTEEGYLLGCNAIDPRAIGRLCEVTGATQERLLRFAGGPDQERWLSGPTEVSTHPVPLALMRAAGLPLVATAVPPGATPAPTIQHVIFILGDAVDLALNAGAVRREPVTPGR
jgi:tRNA A37 threonylcarbamoyladenosine synthetase subunit TsaC/SUA5/YrdC